MEFILPYSGDRSPIDEVGPWAVEKHERLRRYLEACTTIMRRQEWCKGYEYVDAFAGAGRARLRNSEISIDGSPRIALGLRHPFTAYTFIDSEQSRAQELQTLVDEFPDRDISVHVGDGNHLIRDEVLGRIRYRDMKRGFIFVDPFSVNVEFETLALIAESRAIEIMLHFPTMVMNRTLLRNNPSSEELAKVDERMTKLWGSNDWQELLYEERQSLFGDVYHLKKRPTGAPYLASQFVNQRLRKIFPQVSEPVIIKNTKGADIYALIFAGHNPTACKIANDIFSRPVQPMLLPIESANLRLELPF
jgi:three-Cys-motif partner protein